MQISLYFIIYFCLVKWGNSSIVDSLIICVYTFYIRNKCFEYSLLITASVTCISKSDGSQNSFINLILYTYVYPKPKFPFLQVTHLKKKKKGNIRQKSWSVHSQPMKFLSFKRKWWKSSQRCEKRQISWTKMQIFERENELYF